MFLVPLAAPGFGADLIPLMIFGVLAAAAIIGVLFFIRYRSRRGSQ